MEVYYLKKETIFEQMNGFCIKTMHFPHTTFSKATFGEKFQCCRSSSYSPYSVCV